MADWYCPDCGSAVAEGSKYCVECGARLSFPDIDEPVRSRKKRKKGRMSMVNRPLYQPKHDKKSTDNIISKIKRHFVRSTLNYINKKYNEFLSTKITEKKRILLMKIIPNSYKVYSRKANQKFLNFRY